MLEQAVQLVGHLAWPVTGLIIIYVFRRGLRGVIGAVERRIEDPNTDVSIGREGLELSTRLAAAESKLESLEVDQDDKEVAARERERTTQGLRRGEGAAAPDRQLTTTEQDGVPAELRRLADEYMALDYPDRTRLVGEGDELAREMGALILSQGVDRDLVASSGSEGLILGLSVAVHSSPEAGDLQRLLSGAGDVSRPHVRSRLVLALGRLADGGFMTRLDLPEVRRVLLAYERGAGRDLKMRILGVRARISRMLNRSPEAAEGAL